MYSNLSKSYDPKKVEERIYNLWLKSGFFNPDKLPSRHKKPYTIMMAPLNVTGNIHLGHAFENSISDLLIRFRRLQGYKTLFLPGKDHAGIAAQYVVEKELKKEGRSRFDLGREKFSEKMWQWMKKCGLNIDNQLKKLGLSCDWSRKRFTLDKDYQTAVKTAFLHYYKKGWVYQGERVINWCPRCQTSLSDLELEYKEEKGKLWYIRYPFKPETLNLKPETYIIVATTRPETMLGDAAVAVNPKDKRYENLIGKTVILPLQNREIPIISDEAVDPSFGTGAVKVTPAHDSIDFEIGQRHNLPRYKVIDEKRLMTGDIPSIYRGLPVLECRQKIIKDLTEKNLLEKTEDYLHRVGFCSRCQSIVEPLISKQWFIKMEELAKLAIDAAKKNKFKFIPLSRKKIYFDWLVNIKDWCISRQLWWGHKIPIEGVEDVLDTWFSSALWPFATLGWSEKTEDFKKYYPTDVISSAREIFYLWIVRMVFSGLEFTGKVPFKCTYTHATILDKKGRKMSKSLGNVINPMDLIQKYGTDATRFGLIWQATGTQDIHFDEGPILMGQKFCNKIWNAARFVLLQVQSSKLKVQNSDTDAVGAKLKIKNLTAADKKILQTLDKKIKSLNKDLENFQFGKASQTLYHFFWHDFCDRYIERAKIQMTESKFQKENTKNTLLYVLLTYLKLLHPFLPFLTEEIYQKLPIKKKKCIMIENWPS